MSKTLRVTNQIIPVGSGMSAYNVIGSRSFDIVSSTGVGPLPGLIEIAQSPGTTHLFKGYTFTPGWCWMRNIGSNVMQWGYLYAVLDLRPIGEVRPGESASFRILCDPAVKIYGQGVSGITKIESLVWED